MHSSVGNIVREEVKTPIDLEKSKLPTFPLIGFIPLIIGLFIYDKRRKRVDIYYSCLLYTSPSPRDQRGSRMPSSA